MSGELPREVTVDLEVPFHDVDALQVAWHGHYLKYLEVGRTELMRSRRLDMKEVGELGYRLVVAESLLRHVAPLVYGERIRVRSWFREVEHRIVVAWEITSLTHGGRRAARGHTVLVTTDPQGTLVWITPPALRERLGDVGPAATGAADGA